MTTKENLKTLITLPRHQFDAIIKLINPKLNDNDLRPMFPEQWNDNTNWPEFKYSYDSFRIHQLRIDEQLEKQISY